MQKCAILRGSTVSEPSRVKMHQIRIVSIPVFLDQIPRIVSDDFSPPFL